MKILVIDKYPIMRKGISFEIMAHFSDSTIQESESFNSFLESKQSFEPELIILELNQASDVNYMNGILRLKRCYPLAPLIVYDEKPDPSGLLTYFKAGVSGYLSKQNDLKELTDCINDVLAGKRYVNAEILFSAILNKYPGKRQIPVKSNGNLTSHENEIANYLTKGMKTSWIALKMGRKMSTISTIKANIFKKLKVDNVVALREAIITRQANM